MSEDAEYLEELDEDTYLARARAWNDRKAELFARWLGKAHTDVMHSIIAYPAGGMLDLYYYPHGLPGTAIATMELSELPGMGPSNDAFGCYELVMFTRHAWRWTMRSIKPRHSARFTPGSRDAECDRPLQRRSDAESAGHLRVSRRHGPDRRQLPDLRCLCPAIRFHGPRIWAVARDGNLPLRDGLRPPWRRRSA